LEHLFNYDTMYHYVTICKRVPIMWLDGFPDAVEHTIQIQSNNQ